MTSCPHCDWWATTKISTQADDGCQKKLFACKGCPAQFIVSDGEVTEVRYV
jgi:hypothetical protein